MKRRGGNGQDHVFAGMQQLINRVYWIQASMSEVLVIPGIFTNGERKFLAPKRQELLRFSRIEISHFVKDVIGGQQHFRLHKLHRALTKHGGGIHHRLARFYFGRRHKAADNRDLRNSLRNLFYHLLVSLHKSGLFQQVTGRIATHSQFRKENHLRALRKGLTRRLYDLFGITAEITNGWVDLPESNLHTSSVNRRLILRQPLSQRRRLHLVLRGFLLRLRRLLISTA